MLERFRPPDEDEPKAISKCEYCSENICQGDDYYSTDYGDCHLLCFEYWAMDIMCAIKRDGWEE